VELDRLFAFDFDFSWGGALPSMIARKFSYSVYFAATFISIGLVLERGGEATYQ
jgi:hypothetical protein